MKLERIISASSGYKFMSSFMAKQVFAEKLFLQIFLLIIKEKETC